MPERKRITQMLRIAKVRAGAGAKFCFVDEFIGGGGVLKRELRAEHKPVNIARLARF